MAETAFPLARDVYLEDGNLSLGSGAIDPRQPDVIFSFGKQPLATRDADIKPDGSRVRVGIVGAGDVYWKFIQPALNQRGTERYISDPFMPQAVESNLSEIEHRVDGIENMPDDLDYIVILTPPKLHIEHIGQALAKGVPVLAEKPIASTLEDLEKLDAMLANAKVPVYAIDWKIEHAKPLIWAALQRDAISVPYSDALEIHDPEGAFADFDIRDVVKIDARFVEGNVLGDLKNAATARSWLLSYCQGGGMLNDLGIHLLNTLAVPGFRQTGIDEVVLGVRTEQKGHYLRFGKEPEGEESGELYGCAHVRMGIEGGRQDIETIIEVGKAGAVNDGMIELTDSRGRRLLWRAFPVSHLEMRDERDNVVATASMQADCYSLIFEHATHHAASGRAFPLYYPEQADMIRAIAEMHRVGRSQEVAPGEIVRQLGLEEAEQHEAGADPEPGPEAEHK